VKKQLVIAI